MRLLHAGLFASGLLLLACEHEHHHDWMTHVPAGQHIEVPVADLKIEVLPPPFSDGAFPCTECHDPEIPVNTKRRKLEMAHTEIQLHHDEAHRWCFDCHAEKNRDKLRLASGELIDFTESYRLCGQCHGDKYRDWRAGVHGRRTGDWNGHKTYLLCVTCHVSHDPKFKPLEPKPAPVRPESIAQKGAKL